MKTIPRVCSLSRWHGLCMRRAVCAGRDGTPAKPKAAKPAGQGQQMPMPKPAPEMTKLIKTLSGTWNVTEKHEMNPMMPTAEKAQARPKSGLARVDCR